MNIKKILCLMACTALFSIQVQANSGVPPMPDFSPGVKPVAAPTTVFFNKVTMKATINWNKSSNSVKPGESRKIEFRSNEYTSSRTVREYIETGLKGSLTVDIPRSPGEYKLCHVTTLKTNKASSCTGSVKSTFVISHPVVKNKIMDMDSIVNKRDFDGDFWLEFDLGGIGAPMRTFKLHNLTTGVISDLLDYGVMGSGLNLGNSKIKNGQFHASLAFPPLFPGGDNTPILKKPLLSGDYKVAVQNCPGITAWLVSSEPPAGICSEVNYSDVFTIEKKPLNTGVAVPSRSSIPSANITVSGVSFAQNSIDPRYIISKRSKIKNGNWGQWSLFKTISVASTDLTKASSQIVSVNNLAHNTEHSFKVKACNSICSEEFVAPHALSVTYLAPLDFTSSQAISNDGRYTVSWKTTNNPGVDAYYLKEINTGTETLYAPTKNKVNVPFSQTKNGQFKYQVKACYNIQGAEPSCSPYSSVKTITVNLIPSILDISIDRNKTNCIEPTPEAADCFTRTPAVKLNWGKDTSGLVQYYNVYGEYSNKGGLLQDYDASGMANFSLERRVDALATTTTFDAKKSGDYRLYYEACRVNSGVESCSTRSNQIDVRVALPVNQAPILRVIEDGNITGMVEGPYSVEWDHINGATKYELYQRLASIDTFGDPIATLGQSDVVSDVVTFNYAPPLIAWGEHQYYVVASNASNVDDKSGSTSSTISVAVELDETDELRKQLYYNEADAVIEVDAPQYGQYARNNAAFRYLDLMYRFNGASVVSDYFGAKNSSSDSQQFSFLYSDKERRRVENVLTILKENLRQGHAIGGKSFTRSKDLLLDVFYDRAVAEIVLGNQYMDLARIARLRKDSDNSVEADSLEDAHAAYDRALTGYVELFIGADYNYTGLLKDRLSDRKQKSPRYWEKGAPVNVIGAADTSSLLNGYKDLAMYFDLMAKVINSKVELVKLEVHKTTRDQNTLDSFKNYLGDLKEDLVDWTSALNEKLRGNIDENFFNTLTTTGALQAMERYEQEMVNLNNAISWLNGESNILGLNDDDLIIVSGSAMNSDQINSSFDVMMADLIGTDSNEGYLTTAKKDFEAAVISYDNYRYNQDRVRSEYGDRNNRLNDLLVNLIGWEVPLGCNGASGQNCVIRSDDAIAGSEISMQIKRIESAEKDMETAVTRLDSIESNIQDLVAAEIERTGIEGLINETILDYGYQQASISTKIASIEAQRAKRARRKQLIGNAVKVGTAIFYQDYTGAGMGLLGAVSDLKEANTFIKEINSIGALKGKSSELAAAERVDINTNYTMIRKIEFEVSIKSRLRDFALVELDIEKAGLRIEQENERLIGLINQAARLITQIEQTNKDLAGRYFSDPIHATRLTKAMEKAERSFEYAQRWMFYAAKALEYKWLIDFNFNGYSTEGILSARTVSELEGILTSGLVRSNRENDISDNIDSGQYKLSLKENIFGYLDESGGEYLYYPDPRDNGNDSPALLLADEAFQARLAMGKETLSNGDWVTIRFDTFRPKFMSSFFAGPIFDNSKGCMKEAGNYLNRIESIGIYVHNNYSSLLRTDAYLSYGGTSYSRTKKPGIAEANGGGFDIDELTALPVRFWENDNDELKSSKSVNIKAVLADSGEVIPVTLAFKERSVAASDWYVRIQLTEGSKKIIAIEDINDIQLIINHKYVTRDKINSCD